MKNLILITTFLLSASFNVKAQNFKEVYDFEVGNVFQYNLIDYGGESGEHFITNIIDKYTIMSKDIIGDTIKYSISGKTLYHSYGYDPFLGTQYDHRYNVTDINSVLTYIDSANNFLNKPKGSLVMLIPPYAEDTVLSRVLIELSSTINKKIVGGDVHDENPNLFKYHADTTVLDTFPIFTTIYKLSYAQNLGLVEENYWGFEYGYTKILEGYIFGDDTTGIITPDKDFTGIQEVQQNDIKIYPNPAKDYLNFSENITLKNIIVYDLNGRIILRSDFRNNLYIGDLIKGFYFIQLIDAEGSITKYKLLKE